MEQFLRVGVISSTHGLRGEVKVFPTTDDIKRFTKLKKVYLDTEPEKMLLEIEQVRFFKNMVIVKFKGFDDIADSERYKGKDLLVSREMAVKLAPDENFISDLLGLQVVTDEGKDFGIVTDILQTSANDIYVIKGNDGKEYLFPSIKECILNIDLKEQKVLVHIMDGLLDL
ncbi:MAG: ribosome maturation factor RimM [Clostridium sp.]